MHHRVSLPCVSGGPAIVSMGLKHRLFISSFLVTRASVRHISRGTVFCRGGPMLTPSGR